MPPCSSHEKALLSSPAAVSAGEPARGARQAKMVRSGTTPANGFVSRAHH